MKASMLNKKVEAMADYLHQEYTEGWRDRDFDRLVRAGCAYGVWLLAPEALDGVKDADLTFAPEVILFHDTNQEEKVSRAQGKCGVGEHAGVVVAEAKEQTAA